MSNVLALPTLFERQQSFGSFKRSASPAVRNESPEPRGPAVILPFRRPVAKMAEESGARRFPSGNGSFGDPL